METAPVKKIPLNEATAHQLISFAQSVLGITLKPTEKIEAMRAKVSEAWAQPDILIDEPAADEPAKTRSVKVPTQQAVDTELPHGEMVSIQIALEEGPGGRDPVPVGVNGRIQLIPRGQPVQVKREYVEVLKNAEKATYDPLFDANGNPAGYNPVPRMVPMYPWSYAQHYRGV